MFFKTLEECLLTGKKFNSDDFKVVFRIEIFNKMKMCTQMNFVRTLGTEFTRSRTMFPTETTGDTLQVEWWIQEATIWILRDITDNLSGGERRSRKVETVFSFGR